MLFMICGYGIRKQTMKKSVKNQLKLFLPPYVCVIMLVTVGVLMKQLLLGGSLVQRLFYQVLPFILCFHPGHRFFRGVMEQIGPVWCFVTYTTGSVYVNWILQKKDAWMQLLVLAAGIAAALLTTELPLPFCVQQTALCSGFLYLGMQHKKKRIGKQKLPVSFLLFVYVLCSISTSWGGYIEFGSNAFNLGGVDVLLACLAGIVLLHLYPRLNVIQGMAADGIRWIGQHMMWFCCFHTVTYVSIPWNRIADWFGERRLAGILFEFILSFSWALIASLITQRILRRKSVRKNHENGTMDGKGAENEKRI